MHAKRIVSALVVACLILTGCGSTGKDSAKDDAPGPDFPDRLYIGVHTDQPGLAFLDGGSHSGFDIDFARWLGDRLKVTVVLVPLTTAERQTYLERGLVQLVIASYSKTDERALYVDFAAPYMIDQQGVLTRSGDNAITTEADISDRSMCTISGSTSHDQLLKWRALVTTEPIIKTCVDGLLAGHLSAVSTDRLILAGYAARHPELHLQDFTFGNQERYGVGLPNDSNRQCEVITRLIAEFVNSGAWQNTFNQYFRRVEPSRVRPNPSALDTCEKDHEEAER